MRLSVPTYGTPCYLNAAIAKHKFVLLHIYKSHKIKPQAQKPNIFLPDYRSLQAQIDPKRILNSSGTLLCPLSTYLQALSNPLRLACALFGQL